MQNLLITCNMASETPFVLIGVGFEHGRELSVYGEADHEAVAFVVRAVNLDTAQVFESGMLPPTTEKVGCRVLLRTELDTGRWLLSLETLAKGTIARRAIEVKDG